VTDESSYSALFGAAMKLIRGDISLDGQTLARPGFFEKRRLVKALRLLEKAALVEPQYGAASLIAAKVEERLGNPANSLLWLRKAREVAPDNVIVSLELGAALSRQGHQSEAVKVLSTAAEMSPDDPRVQSNLGVALLMAGDVTGAVAAFHQLVLLEPQNSTNSRCLALAKCVHAGYKPRPTCQAELIRSLQEATQEKA
jgi:Flp pilus assembly protein TadD